MKTILIRLSPIFISIFILIIGGAGLYFYQNSKKAGTDQQIISELGKLIDLPEGETPTIATINDIEKLKNQPAFAKAKNGDKVIIYQLAKKAIIYDPKAKRIIDVTPVNTGTPSAQTAPQEATSGAKP